MDGGAWWSTVHGVAKSQTQLSDFTFNFSLSCIGGGNLQPTPVFLPGESQGQRSLVGCHLWGHTESDTADLAAAEAAVKFIRRSYNLYVVAVC